MSIILKPGTRLRSTVCAAEVVVVKAPAEPVQIRCGGADMVVGGEEVPAGGAPVPPFDGGTQIGKRYVDDAGTVELLCSKAGDGSLSLGEEALRVKSAKPLPSSD